MKYKNQNRNRRGNAGKTNAAARDAEAHLPNRYRSAPEFDEAGVIKGAPSFAPVLIVAGIAAALFAGLGIFM